MAADLDLAYTAATELAARIRAKELSPVEIVENALARIEEVNPVLNAFCFVYPEEAMAAARQAEADAGKGKALGPLHGVPIAIKDFTPTAGKVTTRGSFSHENWVPDRDSLIVERLRAAGAIMVGKTTTPEFAYSSFTRSPLWGHTRNPWDPAKTSGGSSGGSAVAVATGCVPLAEGTDMGGSVRIPASFCGIAGLKPSLGRIPMDILSTVYDPISHFGPLARTLDDAALFLRCCEGSSDRDYQSQSDPRPLPAPLGQSVKGMKLALSYDLGFFAIDPEVRSAVAAAADAFRDAGATVEEVELDWTAAQVAETWNDYWGAFMAAGFGHTLKAYRDKMDPNVVALIETGQSLSAQRLMEIQKLWTGQWQSLAKVFERFDALLCPTMALPPPDAETPDEDFDRIDQDGRLHGLDMTHPFNNVGRCPVLSVPCGWTDGGGTGGGLPIGLQIVGHRYDDPTVMRIGAAWEILKPWADKRPPYPQM